MFLMSASVTSQRIAEIKRTSILFGLLRPGSVYWLTISNISKTLKAFLLLGNYGLENYLP